MNIDVANGIRLTEVRPSDKEALVEHLADRSIYENTLRIPHPYSEADADKWLAYSEDKTHKNNGEPVIWAIRNEEDRLIGAVGLDDLVVGESHRTEMGYWLAKPFWGRGITTAVVQAICQHAFKNLGVVKITAHVRPSNIASGRVLEKCGFQREGYLRKQFRKNGEFLDAVAYGLLRE